MRDFIWRCAIAGESQVRGRGLGVAKIANRFALVEVGDAAAERVIAWLRASP